MTDISAIISVIILNKYLNTSLKIQTGAEWIKMTQLYAAYEKLSSITQTERKTRKKTKHMEVKQYVTK